jgi:hypothetical protein
MHSAKTLNPNARQTIDLRFEIRLRISIVEFGSKKEKGLPKEVNSEIRKASLVVRAKNKKPAGFAAGFFRSDKL